MLRRHRPAATSQCYLQVAFGHAGCPASSLGTVGGVHVLIAGGHGKIALRLTALLAGRGDTVTGVIRTADHRDEVEVAGAVPVVLDLESASVAELADAARGADAVVFAAGAGPGSGVERKDSVDRAAAQLLADAAAVAGVNRYLLVSATGVDAPPAPDAGEVWVAYLRAKKAGEDAIRGSALSATVLRPGRLTDDPGTGRVRLAPPPVDRAEVTRDDTAAVLAALLDNPGTAGMVLELRSGEIAIADAITAVLGGERA